MTLELGKEITYYSNRFKRKVKVSIKNSTLKSGVIAHVCNLSTQETEAGRF
jgi:hypothetical protein